jgi:hypothetical protein
MLLLFYFDGVANSEKERYELDALLSLVKKERKSRSTDQFCRY